MEAGETMLGTQKFALDTKYVVTEFKAGATEAFEEMVLKENQKGMRLDDWAVDDSGKFHLIYTGIREVTLTEKEEMVGTTYTVVPWQIFTMKLRRKLPIRAGSEFYILRQASDYHYINAGDPANLVGLDGCEVLAECTVRHIQKTNLGSMTRNELTNLSILYSGHNKNDLLKILRKHYQSGSIDENTPLALIKLRVDKGSSNYNFFSQLSILWWNCKQKLLTGWNQ